MHLAPSTAWVWLIACAVVILFFPLAAQFGNLKGKLSSFRTWVWAIALLGIVAAGFMPFAVDAGNTHFEVQSFIFFITGTLLGVLFLGEFHRLNAQKRLKHPQRVHAERRTRYSKAVEHLAYPNPAVRASAISTLAGLVDEWLADEQLSVEARQKEGQVIVNALCAYVRSPFARAFKAEAFESDAPPANYAGDFATDLAAFRGEQDVRRSVFVEMSKRSSTLAENEKGEVAVVPGAWSGFEFDFSRAPIFYPLSNLTIEKGIFPSSKLYAGASFRSTRFISDADFSEATFISHADFSGTEFTSDTNFFKANFTNNTNFAGAVFTNDAAFSWANFTGEAYFSEATFTNNADFSGATFTGNANFVEATFTSDASFIGATFTSSVDFSGATFVSDANFGGVDFTRRAYFSEATFTNNADFSGVAFAGDAYFVEVTFTSDANFIGTTFTSNAYFGEATFTNNANFTKAVFTGTAYFSETTFTQNARFSETAFAQVAHFSRATFEGLAGFRDATFEAGAEFYGASFVQTADFCDSSFVKSPPLFAVEDAESGEVYRARFVALSTASEPTDQEAAGQEVHNFAVYEGSQPIPLGTAGLNGVDYRIPVGTVLFDPASWDERQKEYTRMSEPAQ